MERGHKAYLVYKLLKSAICHEDVSFGFACRKNVRLEECHANKLNKCRFVVMILIKNVFHSAEGQENATLIPIFNLTLKRNLVLKFLFRTAPRKEEKTNRKHISWKDPQYIPSVTQQHFMNEQI